MSNTDKKIIRPGDDYLDEITNLPIGGVVIVPWSFAENKFARTISRLDPGIDVDFDMLPELFTKSDQLCVVSSHESLIKEVERIQKLMTDGTKSMIDVVFFHQKGNIITISRALIEYVSDGEFDVVILNPMDNKIDEIGGIQELIHILSYQLDVIESPY